MATEPLPDPCSWPVGDCCFTEEMQRLRAEVDAFREDAANYYRVAKEADAQQAALRARVATLEGDLNVARLQLGARVCSECPAKERVAELAQLLDEGSAYVHSFAMLSKHPTAPAYAMDLAQRMRSAAGLSGNKTEVPK